MAPRQILLWLDARLAEVCASLTSDMSALAANLLDTRYAAPGQGLLAICAPHKYDQLDKVLTLGQIGPAPRTAAERAMQ